MVDDKFRSYRNRDSVAREGSEQTSRGGIGNLLAELARLTGQGDPYADGGRDGASSALDWAADDASPGQRQQGGTNMLPFRAPNHPLCSAGFARQRRSAAGFCRAPKHRRCCSPRPTTATMAISRRPKLAKLTAPMITMISRARAGKMVSSS